jgi:hypothetical protein
MKFAPYAPFFIADIGKSQQGRAILVARLGDNGATAIVRALINLSNLKHLPSP